MNLISDLNNIDINQNTRMCSFDITNMYINIPLNSVINSIRDTLAQGNRPHTFIQEIGRINNTILEQNYFQHNNQFFKQK
jgi:type II secretory pathway component HofQ